MTMKRSTFLASTSGALAATAMPFTARAAESEIRLVTPTGSISGTLTLPDSPAPYPAVLIVAGSGPVDRNGNSGAQLRSDTYKLLAAALAKAGIASVRYDKRGIGASAAAAPAEADLRFGMYVDDAVAWVKLLAADRRFTGVTIAGHSEGALIGTVAAQEAKVRALVLLEQLKSRVPPDLYAQADRIITQLQSGHTVANTPVELAALFRPSAQPYLISWFKYDPAAELAKVRVPVTIVQGTADIQVTMTDAAALKAALPSARMIVVQGMNHVLKYAPDTSSMQAIMKAYEDPSLPVAPQAVNAVVTAAQT